MTDGICISYLKHICTNYILQYILLSETRSRYSNVNIGTYLDTYKLYFWFWAMTVKSSHSNQFLQIACLIKTVVGNSNCESWRLKGWKQAHAKLHCTYTPGISIIPPRSGSNLYTWCQWNNENLEADKRNCHFSWEHKLISPKKNY